MLAKQVILAMGTVDVLQEISAMQVSVIAIATQLALPRDPGVTLVRYKLYLDKRVTNSILIKPGHSFFIQCCSRRKIALFAVPFFTRGICSRKAKIF